MIIIISSSSSSIITTSAAPRKELRLASLPLSPRFRRVWDLMNLMSPFFMHTTPAQFNHGVGLPLAVKSWRGAFVPSLHWQWKPPKGLRPPSLRWQERSMLRAMARRCYHSCKGKLRGSQGSGVWTSVDMRVCTCNGLRVKHNQTSSYLRPLKPVLTYDPSRIIVAVSAWTGINTRLTFIHIHPSIITASNSNQVYCILN